MPRAALLALTLVALIATPSRGGDSGASSIPGRFGAAALRPSRPDVAVRDVAYDSAYRLVHDDKDVADASLDAIGTNLTSVPVAPFVSANASDYVLDAAGNRRQTTIAGVTAGYSLEAGAPSQDAAMNQYTVIGSAVRSHDPVGNLISSSDSGRQAFFDADNRLVQWTEGTKDIRYRYDADGRRILKEDVQGSPTFARTITFWDGWQEVEEYVPSGGGWAMNKRFVFGEGIDEVLKATLPDAADIDNDANTTEPVDLWYHHNSLGSVVAVTNASGAVKESYRYSAYGQVSIFDKNGNATSSTQVKQPFMFTGRRLDFEEGSGLYYYRLRYLDPVAGRFVSRDPLGNWGDAAQNGNGQSYCRNNPVNGVDPLGLQDEWRPEDAARPDHQQPYQGNPNGYDPSMPPPERPPPFPGQAPGKVPDGQGGTRDETMDEWLDRWTEFDKANNPWQDYRRWAEQNGVDPDEYRREWERDNQAEPEQPEDPLAPPPPPSPPLTPEQQEDLRRQRLDDLRRKTERDLREAQERLRRIRDRRPNQPRWRGEDAAKQEARRKERELQQLREMIRKWLRDNVGGMRDKLWPDRPCPPLLPTDPRDLGGTRVRTGGGSSSASGGGRR